jgi:hypothetical protein
VGEQQAESNPDMFPARQLDGYRPTHLSGIGGTRSPVRGKLADASLSSADLLSENAVGSRLAGLWWEGLSPVAGKRGATREVLRYFTLSRVDAYWLLASIADAEAQ